MIIYFLIESIIYTCSSNVVFIYKENKILIPNYICKSLLTPIIKLDINYSFYNIDDNFKLVFRQPIRRL
jgi:hypothetical protein